MKRCVLSLERNIGDEFRILGECEFQSWGPMTEKSMLPSDVRTSVNDNNNNNNLC